jgi:hypothetical protein
MNAPFVSIYDRPPTSRTRYVWWRFVEHRLPPINRKIEQYYISEEYKFRVAREIRESERKKIEAEGISEFQQVVSKGISESYLRWRGIEARLQLAQSSNSKIVIMGGGKNGLADHPGQCRSARITDAASSDWKRRHCIQGEDDGCNSRNTIGENAGREPDEAGGEDAARSATGSTAAFEPVPEFVRYQGSLLPNYRGDAPFGGRPVRQRLSKQACCGAATLTT